MTGPSCPRTHFFVVLQVDSIQSDALFILLVEKDAAFMRLAEDRFYNTYPCIILTAKGQPDVASRCSQTEQLAVNFFFMSKMS